jgi:hypothetical protein
MHTLSRHQIRGGCRSLLDGNRRFQTVTHLNQKET